MDNALLEKLWEQFWPGVEIDFANKHALAILRKLKLKHKMPLAIRHIVASEFECYVAGYLAGKEDSDA